MSREPAKTSLQHVGKNRKRRTLQENKMVSLHPPIPWRTWQKYSSFRQEVLRSRCWAYIFYPLKQWCECSAWTPVCSSFIGRFVKRREEQRAHVCASTGARKSAWRWQAGKLLGRRWPLVLSPRWLRTGRRVPRGCSSRPGTSWSLTVPSAASGLGGKRSVPGTVLLIQD